MNQESETTNTTEGSGLPEGGTSRKGGSSISQTANTTEGSGLTEGGTSRKGGSSISQTANWLPLKDAPRNGKPFLVYEKGLYAIYRFDEEFGHFEAQDDPYLEWYKARGWTHLPEMPEHDPE